jgi:hypothetical protein
LAIVDYPGVLIQVAGLCFLAGMGWALLAAGIIYLGSTLLSPRIPRGRIWQDWRSRRMVWGVSIILTAPAAALSAEQISRPLVSPTLHWLFKRQDLLLIGITGSLCGYLFVLLVFVTAALLARRRASKA